MRESNLGRNSEDNMTVVDKFISEAKDLFENQSAGYKYVGLYNQIRSSSQDFSAQSGLIISNENFDYLAAYLTVMSFADAEPTVFLSADYGQLESEYFKRKDSPDGRVDICVIVGEVSTLTSSIGDLNVSDEDAVQEVTDRYLGLVTKFTAISDMVFVTNFPLVKTVFSGYSSNAKQSVSRRILMSNILVEQVCNDISGCQVIDLFTFSADVGMKNWFNHRDWYTARVPGGAKYGVEITRMFRPFLQRKSGTLRKVLALDFDNTLWGGVAGEDGVEGVKVGGAYPGNVYEAFQKHARGLKDRGIILVAASKNNFSDVEPIFSDRPEMILCLEDFSVIKVDWNEKVSNLHDAAQELNLGIDSFVFVDDNPLEIDKVKSAGLDIECILIPQPSENFGEFYDHLYSCFPLEDITEEDKVRADMYAVDKKRSVLRYEFESFTDYIRSIEPVITINSADETTLDRIVQLHQKTNQFNLTTVRFGAKDILAFLGDNNKRIYVFSLKDKFGDLGIISAAVISLDLSLGEASIDSFLMSCRAMGRKAEYSMLSLIISHLHSEGIRSILGLYTSTEKNGPASDFFDNFGFDFVQYDISGKTKIYSLDASRFFSKNFIEDLGVKVNGTF
jgi:FkbH-like protein